MVTMSFTQVVIFLILPGASYGANAVQVVLRGNWFSPNQLGESGGYLMSDFKSKIFEPLVNRVAQKIFENEQRQSANFWILMDNVLIF